MEPFKLESKEYFAIQPWEEENPDLVVGFSTKVGGKSIGDFSRLNFGFHVGDDEDDVRHNRSLFSEKIQFPLAQWVGAEQTHDISIQKIKRFHQGKGAESYTTAFRRTDGFFTNEKGVLLTLCFADCVPLYFLDKENGYIGLAHAGWKGSVHGIAGEMMSLFVQNGSNPKDIFAVIGPSICKKCYIVDDRVVTLVEKVLEGVEKKPYNQINQGQYSLDLKKLNKQILVRSGLAETNILETSYCTSCNHNYFYSHRRDDGKTGRMIAFIGWKEVLHP
ncbi:peptidoglycan editing factor PgeF [Bacillus sp. B15-48]|uniref:peptidoglycan editing factor PgeF n=1 Tax=Bacillus sp. B15-48 TaxID=1548601 RepID=UPI0019401188|nr:peptidoglycan editing factor PgeF [Bacillus sp. B15-48]MBM4764009.1 peptidoglycan editing factor PgeF [Bacillus sp. B15-48]